eukprot:scpid77172/ scgid8567/ JmjC domain-containing protein 8; Jumonji domain-containing protein 8
MRIPMASQICCLLVGSSMLLALLSALCMVAEEDEQTSRNGGWKKGGSLVTTGPCTITRVNAANLSLENFAKNFVDAGPVLIEGIDNNQEFRRECTRDNLITAYGHRRIKLTTATSTSLVRAPVSLKYYIENMMQAQSVQTPANESLYHFGDTDREEWKSVFDLYNFPAYQVPGMEPMISFGLAGPGTGVPMHFHGPTFAQVMYGRKRWFFYPPSQDFRVGYHSDLSMLQWYLEEYPLLDDVTRPLECTLEPNQLLYFPDRWWHSTINIDESVFVSTFLSPSPS